MSALTFLFTLAGFVALSAAIAGVVIILKCDTCKQRPLFTIGAVSAGLFILPIMLWVLCPVSRMDRGIVPRDMVPYVFALALLMGSLVTMPLTSGLTLILCKRQWHEGAKFLSIVLLFVLLIGLGAVVRFLRTGVV